MGSLDSEAVSRLGSPQATEGRTLITVAAVGIAVNSTTALLFMRGRKDDLNIRGAFQPLAADAVVIVRGTWSLFKQSPHLMSDGVPAGVDLAAVRTLRAGSGCR